MHALAPNAGRRPILLRKCKRFGWSFDISSTFDRFLNNTQSVDRFSEQVCHDKEHTTILTITSRACTNHPVDSDLISFISDFQYDFIDLLKFHIFLYCGPIVALWCCLSSPCYDHFTYLLAPTAGSRHGAPRAVSRQRRRHDSVFPKLLKACHRPP